VRLVLASASPRRADLLTSAGFLFEVRPVEVDESLRPGEGAANYVRRLAGMKAETAAEPLRADEIVLGADTTVVVDGGILGKPRDDKDAAVMLRQLSGRTHEVLTGVVLRHGRRTVSDVARTVVQFAPLTDDDLAWYVGSGEPRDKAGAYGIQGLASRFVESIDGSYTNVVGLPVALVARLVRDLVLTAGGDGKGSGGAVLARLDG
jgi:septum formation protein